MRIVGEQEAEELAPQHLGGGGVKCIPPLKNLHKRTKSLRFLDADGTQKEVILL